MNDSSYEEIAEETVRTRHIEFILNRMELLRALETDDVVFRVLEDISTPQLTHSYLKPGATNEELYNALLEITSIPIEYKELSGNALGYISFVEKKIVIRKNMPLARSLETLLHLVITNMVHGNNPSASCSSEERIVADATTYVIANHFGFKLSNSLVSDFDWHDLDGSKIITYLQEISEKSEILISVVDDFFCRTRGDSADENEKCGIIQLDLFTGIEDYNENEQVIKKKARAHQ